jgi:hypothetical protein
VPDSLHGYEAANHMKGGMSGKGMLTKKNEKCKMRDKRE